MKNEVIKAEFDGSVIQFREDGWFNATEAAAKYGKRPADWFENKETQEYLLAASEILNVPKDALLKVRRGKYGGGTWLHPRLAVRFAQWLDMRFAVWCDTQIDNIIRGNHPALDWKRLRHEASSSYKVMQEILQLSRSDDGKETKPHHYSNEARLINWAITGSFGPIDRQQLTCDELSLLAHLEARNAVLIGRGVEYALRKAMLEQAALDWRIAKDLPQLAAESRLLNA